MEYKLLNEWPDNCIFNCSLVSDTLNNQFTIEVLTAIPQMKITTTGKSFKEAEYLAFNQYQYFKHLYDCNLVLNYGKAHL